MANVVGWVGRALLTLGILLLLFVAYQLWGTGIYQARQQDELSSQFERTAETHHRSAVSTTSPAPSTTLAPAPSSTTTTLPPPFVPPNGDAIAKISVPKIGMDQVVVEGVDVPDLRKGPGHYPATSLAGYEGNMAIAGHRTTYGAPFGDLDQLKPGDEITVESLDKVKYTYKVTDQGPFVVDPNDASVLAPKQDPAQPGHFLSTLTLTTCNPKYSAAQRLIVQADLVLPAGETPLPPLTADAGRKVTSTIRGLSGDSGSRAPAILWGLIAVLVGGAWWFVFHRYKKWYVWIAGAVPFLVVLFVFYTYLERLLPSDY